MNEKTRILIVDDEPINLDFFDVMLSRLGFEVEKAYDGEDALEKVRVFEPDLMLLDNIMPKLSGWEVTRTLRSNEDFAEYRDMPIIMFSAMDDVKDKIEGFELGIDDYIIKPFNFSEVLARIRAVLRHRTLYRQILAKERRIALVETLNQSLIYFTRHLKEPVLKLLDRAGKLNPGSADTADFLDAVQRESREVLAALEGLEDEIRELEEADEALESNDISLEDLEEKFQSHFQELKRSVPDGKGVSR